MTQTDAQRKAARPAWARYKNRKKTLRIALREGRITDDEHAALMRDARAIYYAAPQQPSPHLESTMLGSEWCAAHPDHAASDDVRAGDCHESCVGALEATCICWCEGRNHGVAHGMDPLDVRARKQHRSWVDDRCSGYLRALTIAMGRGVIDRAARTTAMTELRAHLEDGGVLPANCGAALRVIGIDIGLPPPPTRAPTIAEGDGMVCERPSRRSPDSVRGTVAGYYRHIKAGEPACDDCRAAKREHRLHERRRAKAAAYLERRR